jgi:hypothetical protein
MTIRREDGAALNNTNIITLYHGSIYDFNKIDVARGKPNKDFGRGFYTSRTEQQAVNLAKRNRQIEQNRLALISDKTQVPAWLYVYEFDLLKADALNVKEFKQADFEWVDFIVENRFISADSLPYQTFFGTAKAASLLAFKDRRIIP